MPRSSLLALVDPKILKILQVLLAKSTAEFHLHELAAQARVPVATTFRLVRKLVALSLLTPHTHGKMKLYQLSPQKKEEVRCFLGGPP